MKRRYLEDEKQSLLLFLAVWVIFSVLNMTKNCYSGAMAAIVNEGVLTKSQTGAIGAMFYLIYTACQFGGGFIVERYSVNWPVMFGVVGGAIANLVIYFNQNYTVMMITWCLNGAVQSATYPAFFKILSTQLFPEHRSKAVFYFTLTAPAGYFASYLCASLVSRWQYNFLISCLLLVGCAVYWFVTYRTSVNKMVEAEAIPVSQAPVKQQKQVGLLKLIVSSGLIVLWFVIIVQTVFNQGIKGLTSVMLMESYETISPAHATGLNSLMMLMGVIGTFLTRKFLLSRIENETVGMTYLFAVTLPALVILTFIGKWPVFVIIVALAWISLVMTAAYMVNSYIYMRFAPFGYVGTISGIMNGAPALGICLSNYVFAKIAEGCGWTFTTKVWVIMCIISIALLILVIPLWKKMIPKK